MGIDYQRGSLLYGQKRYALATTEFRKELAQNPDNSSAMSMLALSLNYDHKPKEALEQAQAAVAADPERGFVHYALACITMGTPWQWSKFYFFNRLRLVSYRRRLRRARRFGLEAVRLDPYNVVFLAFMSAIELDLRRPKKSLDWAEKGLAVRANDVRCTNLRARALAKLGRREEARQTFKGALALDPDSAATRYQGGWTHLHVGDADQAVEHFQESVRLDPNNSSAHRGLRAAKIIAATRTRRKLAYIGVAIGFAAWAVSDYFASSSTSADKVTMIGFHLSMCTAFLCAGVKQLLRGRYQK